MSLLPPHYKAQEVTADDIIIASLAFGFTLGFGYLTTWNATRQTWVAYKKTGRRVFQNVYIRMVWGEIIVCLAFGIICFLHLRGVIPPCFAFFFGILTLWALQVHLLLQIIINRCRIIAHDKRFAGNLRIGVAVFITLVNISVYNIWIPARLEISQTYIHTNEWWDRVEKVIYLLVDAFLNMYFVRVVQHGLVRNGLTKYRGLVHFNMFIIGFSLSMDVLIIAMMSLPNTFVYMQFHPLAYIVKLNIELSMADLIGRIARNKNHAEFIESNLSSNSDSRKPARLQNMSTSNSGPIKVGRRNNGFRAWEHGPDTATGFGFNDLTRPDAVYTVNASSNTDIAAPFFRDSKDIYTTREFRVDFEDAFQPYRGVTAPNTASTSRKENEDLSHISLSESDQDGHITTDDTYPEAS